jgi:hypothetical protein
MKKTKKAFKRCKNISYFINKQILYLCCILHFKLIQSFVYKCSKIKNQKYSVDKVIF